MFLFILITVVVMTLGLAGFLFRAGVGAATTSIALSLTLFFGWMAFGTEDTITVKVVGKERIADKDGGRWMVYAAPAPGTSDGYTDERGQRVGETFKNGDAWFHGKTRSTDLQRQLVVGRAYKCKVNGFRSGLLSRYRNVLSCEGLVNG